jgi:hypothetical protein
MAFIASFRRILAGPWSAPLEEGDAKIGVGIVISPPIANNAIRNTIRYAKGLLLFVITSVKYLI